MGLGIVPSVIHLLEHSTGSRCIYADVPREILGLYRRAGKREFQTLATYKTDIRGVILGTGNVVDGAVVDLVGYI